jgi:hypothetical protein
VSARALAQSPICGGTSRYVHEAMGYAAAPAGSTMETRKSDCGPSCCARPSAAAVVASTEGCTNCPARFCTEAVCRPVERAYASST